MLRAISYYIIKIGTKYAYRLKIINAILKQLYVLNNPITQVEKVISAPFSLSVPFNL